MAAVDVRIGHNDNFMIAELFFVKFLADTATKGRNHIFNLFGLQNSIQARLFYI